MQQNILKTRLHKLDITAAITYAEISNNNLF